jgi:hypothetical protein
VGYIGQRFVDKGGDLSKLFGRIINGQGLGNTDAHIMSESERIPMVNGNYLCVFQNAFRVTKPWASAVLLIFLMFKWVETLSIRSNLWCR